MYRKTRAGVIRLRDGAFIPEDPSNTDYLEYLRWREEGNEPEPIPREELETEAKLRFRERKALRKSQVLSELGFESLEECVLYLVLKDPKAQKFAEWFMLYDGLLREFLENQLGRLSEKELEELDPEALEEEMFQKSLRVSNGLTSPDSGNMPVRSIGPEGR